jgi:hypothetical protein
MEHQIIERLAMDAALGELNEDAEALLDAYLAEHPDARRWAQHMQTVCARTQEAIDIKTRRKDAPTCIPAAIRPQRIVVPWARLGRWAAVVAISLIAGAVIGRWAGTHAIAPETNVAVETMHSGGFKNWQELLSEPGKGFWEAKAAAIWRSEPRRNANPQRNLWETLRQLQKGHNHEQSHQ